MRDRAKKFGPIYEHQYLELYGLLSSYVHSGSAAYDGLSAEALEAVYVTCLDSSRKMYSEAIKACSDLFSLNKVIKDFSGMLEFIEDAPAKILTKRAINEIKNKIV